MVGYLFTRLRELGVGPWATILSSAVLRGTYHLYQGFGPFVGNVAMGIVFGWCYQRWGRTMPLVIAHWMLDMVSFIGYPLAVGWWPELFARRPSPDGEARSTDAAGATPPRTCSPRGEATTVRRHRRQRLLGRLDAGGRPRCAHASPCRCQAAPARRADDAIRLEPEHAARARSLRDCARRSAGGRRRVAPLEGPGALLDAECRAGGGARRDEADERSDEQAMRSRASCGTSLCE